MGNDLKSLLTDAAPRPREALAFDRLWDRAVAVRRRRHTRRLTASVLTALVAIGAVVASVGTDDNDSTVATSAPEPGWELLPSAPIAARSADLVWTGKEMIVWGGYAQLDRAFNDGAAYDPVTRRWRLLAPSPLPVRGITAIVWTGSELLVWGGVEHNENGRVGKVDGAAYDPSRDRWRRIPPAPLPPRDMPALVWTGEELLVLGGDAFVPRPDGMTYDHVPVVDAAAYNPTTNRWRTVPSIPLPVGDRWAYDAVWVDGEVLVAGALYRHGRATSTTAIRTSPSVPARAPAKPPTAAAVYDPDTDRWRLVAPPPVSATAALVSTGHDALGFTGAELTSYDPKADRWELLPSSPRPTRGPEGPWLSATWTGRVLVAGSASYDPQTREWHPLPSGPLAARDSRAAWADDRLLTWGGTEYHREAIDVRDVRYLSDGAALVPTRR